VDLGARKLRGIPEPVRVFEVRSEGLRDKFPSLRTVERTPGNLRAQASSFVGRDHELRDVEEAVRAHRLVTLTGVGGVGKTRLAIEVATRLAPEFADGVWVIELASVGDPAAVADAVATVLGITQREGMTVAGSVASALEGRHRLLVLDNCEHVVDAAAELIDAILRSTDTVRVMATSREGLRAADEHLWPVPPLSVREGAGSAGVALFTERARAVVPGWAPAGAEEADAVVEICRRLDGIPLAIELAASRMVSMSGAEVRDRLGDRFRLLGGSRRGLERHQTLRNAVEWSYELLSGDERALLTRCSVFAGGFDLTAAAIVGGDGRLDEYAVLDLLDALVRKSLLMAQRALGGTRYAMLETIRQFAEGKLADAGGSIAARTAHARYFAGLGPTVLELWNGSRQPEAYEWFDLELANLRSAFRWAADETDLDTAAAIAVQASLLAWWTNRYEPVAWAEELVDAARAGDHPKLAALCSVACLSCLTGRLEDAIRFIEATRALLDDPRYDAVPFGFGAVFVGSAYAATGRFDVWAALSRGELERSSDPLALNRGYLVLALSIDGHTDEAAPLAGETVAAAEATGNPFSLAVALLAYGFAVRPTDPTAALEALRRGLVLARDTANRQVEAHLAFNLAWLEALHGDLRTALDLFAQAIPAYLDGGDVLSVKSVFAVLVLLFDRIGRYEAAATIARFAQSPMSTVGVPEFSAVIDHLRHVLGVDKFEALARGGEAMQPSAMAVYALNEIEGAAATA
jgi:predicted ATPase